MNVSMRCLDVYMYWHYARHNVKFVAQSIILSLLTNKPYEAGSLCFYLDVQRVMCMYTLVSIIIQIYTIISGYELSM